MVSRFLSGAVFRYLLVVGAVVFAGCGTPSEYESAAKGDAAGSGATAENGNGSVDNSNLSPIDLEIVDEAGFQQMLEKHRGKVIFVDYWATWCGVCKQEFPNTVALHKKYADQGLAVVSMSFDTEDRHQAAVEFLREYGATFDNLRSRYGAEDQSFEMCSFDDNLPYYQLYDREGKLVRGFSFSDPIGPAITFEDIEQAVKNQLDVAAGNNE